MNIRHILALMLAFFLHCVPGFASGSMEISIEEEIHTDRKVITLGDIAKIEGGSEKDREKISSIFISRCPSAGQYIRITRKSLESKIYRAGFTNNQFDLSIPSIIKINSNTALVKKHEIVDMAREYLIEQDQWDPGMKTFRQPENNSMKVPVGNRTSVCEVNVDENSPQFMEVKVAVLVNGEAIGEDRVVFQRPNSSQAVSGSGAPDDKGSSRTVVRNDPNLRVKRGDPLRITFSRKSIMVEARGTAAGAGYPGDYIQVKVDKSDKVFKALLKDNKTAFVEI